VCVGLVYDSHMLNSVRHCGDISFHREHGDRIRRIWSRLQQCGLRDQCEVNNAEQITEL